MIASLSVRVGLEPEKTIEIQVKHPYFTPILTFHVTFHFDLWST